MGFAGTVSRFVDTHPTLKVLALSFLLIVGMALIALIGWVFLRQPLDAPAIAGIALITAGAVLLGGFSKAVPH